MIYDLKSFNTLEVASKHYLMATLYFVDLIQNGPRNSTPNTLLLLLFETNGVLLK